MFDGLATLRGSTASPAAARPLLAIFRVGRGHDHHLALDDLRVSQSHGLLRFVRDKGWVLRDLASKNGTFLNGRRIAPGRDVVLKDQDLLSFGSSGASWIFKAGSPSEVAISSEVDQTWRAVGTAAGVIPLPSEDEPSGTVFRQQTDWFLESPSGEARLLTDGEPFVVAGVQYRAWISRGQEPTAESDDNRVSLTEAQLHLSVSLDEEQILAELHAGGLSRKLPARVHLYMLVLLAGYRLEDTKRGIGSGEAGWRFADEVADALRLDPQSLNVQVYRARSDVEKLGFQDPGAIIERRSMTRQMRIGIPPNRTTLTRSDSGRQG